MTHPTPIHDMLRTAYFDYWHAISGSAASMVSRFHDWCEANPGMPNVDQAIVDEELARHGDVEKAANAALKAALEPIMERLA